MLCTQLYCIAGNFWGRKLLQILRIYGYSLKFSLRNFGAWHPLARHKWAICKSFLRKNRIFHQFVKVSSSKVSRYTILSHLSEHYSHLYTLKVPTCSDKWLPTVANFVTFRLSNMLLPLALTLNPTWAKCKMTLLHIASIKSLSTGLLVCTSIAYFVTNPYTARLSEMANHSSQLYVRFFLM